MAHSKLHHALRKPPRVFKTSCLPKASVFSVSLEAKKRLKKISKYSYSLRLPNHIFLNNSVNCLSFLAGQSLQLSFPDPGLSRQADPCQLASSEGRFFTLPQKKKNRITTLQQTNISHLGKRNIIFKTALVGDMLVPRRVLAGLPNH